MTLTVENVCGLLIRSRLLSADESRAVRQRWQTEAPDASANTSQFFKWLVTNNYITEYQAGLLARGRANPDEFFLNQYKILDRLGRGRMAGVYKAVHHLGQMVAIKVLPPSKTKNRQTLARFQREAQLALKLKHPNVVRTFQMGQTPAGLHYLVMEYLDGETLDEVLQRRKRLPPAEAVRIIHQTLEGLQYLHEQGMVHRDLKPANLMLVSPPGRTGRDSTVQATVKILDIGLARVMIEESVQGMTDNPELTAEGTLLGTPDYLAPEQARDPRTIDIRADIYSLGCVLYHALTGRPPFPDTNMLNQMVRHATETPPPLADFNPDIPDGLQQIVNWMMAKKPEERYPTPERAALALQVFLEAESEPVRPSEEGPQMRRFLSWLEASGGEETVTELEAVESGETGSAPRPTAPAPPPAPPRPQPPAPGSPSAGRPAAPQRVRRPATPARPPAPADVPVAPPADIDVELVAVPEKRPLLAPGQGFELAPRDWIMAGAGAAVVLFLGLFVWLLSLLFGGSPSLNEDEGQQAPAE